MVSKDLNLDGLTPSFTLDLAEAPTFAISACVFASASSFDHRHTRVGLAAGEFPGVI